MYNLGRENRYSRCAYSGVTSNEATEALASVKFLDVQTS